MKTKQKTIQILKWIAILTPVFLFYFYFYFYTLNAPINDDFILLTFLDNYINSNTFVGKYDAFVAQHNEHRIVYDRVWSLISYKAFEKLNFNLISLIGNLSLFGIVLLFYKKFKQLNRNLILFLPITIFIFSFTSWENITFPMATLSNFSVMLFSALSLYFTTTEKLKNKYIYSAIFLFLAVITQGSGLFVVPITLLILIYKKEYKNTLLFMFFSCFVLFAYFYDYQNYGQNKGILETISTYKLSILEYFFAFLGNAFNYNLLFTNNDFQSHVFSIIIGIILFLGFLFITYKKYYKKNIFIYSLLLLILTSAIITSVSRIKLGIQTSGASRYRINGIIFFVCVFFWFIDTYKIEKTKFIIVITMFSLTYFYFISLKQIEYLDIRAKKTVIQILSYNSNKSDLISESIKETKSNLETIKKAEELHTYNYPNNTELECFFPISNKINTDITASNTNKNMPHSVETILNLGTDYFIDGWAFIDDLNGNNQNVYIGIKSESEVLPAYYSTKKTKRFDLNPSFKKNSLENCGYNARIKTDEIKTGKSEIFILVVNEDKAVIIKDDKTIIK